MTDVAETTYAAGMLVLEHRAPAAWVTLNRPAKRNALSAGMLRELPDLLADAVKGGATCVVFQGAGGESFSAGFDLDDLAGSTPAEVDAIVSRAYDAVSASAVPTIACITGWCVGAGLELALSCDLRVANDTSTFQLPAGRIGVDYPEHGLSRIAAAAGRANASRMIVLSERFPAADAARMGLVHETAADPQATAHAWAERIVECDAAAINGMRETLRQMLPTTR
jgi:enoyl-CoA hydratase/carnithine racemase